MMLITFVTISGFHAVDPVQLVFCVTGEMLALSCFSRKLTARLHQKGWQLRCHLLKSKVTLLFNHCLVLVQPRKTRPEITEKLSTETQRIKSNQANKGNLFTL